MSGILSDAITAEDVYRSEPGRNGLELDDVAADLRTYRGSPITDRLVRWDRHLWYCKQCHNEPWREVFAWNLGRAWLNIAEVAFADGVENAVWNDGRPLSAGEQAGSVLVRIVQDYNPDDLPIRDLDEAIAAELVFSRWIRRSDAHPWNRAYVGGLPVFFDHHIAFGAEIANLPIKTFFRPGDDGGYAGRWRASVLPAYEVPTTSGERAFSGDKMAIHRVRSLSTFDGLLANTASRIRSMGSPQLTRLAQTSQVPSPAHLIEFLVLTEQRLDDELIDLRTVLASTESF